MKSVYLGVYIPVCIYLFIYTHTYVYILFLCIILYTHLWSALTREHILAHNYTRSLTCLTYTVHADMLYTRTL